MLGFSTLTAQDIRLGPTAGYTRIQYDFEAFGEEEISTNFGYTF